MPSFPSNNSSPSLITSILCCAPASDIRLLWRIFNGALGKFLIRLDSSANGNGIALGLGKSTCSGNSVKAPADSMPDAVSRANESS